ncbi:MAG: FlgD immunoglobulin-like domain containing protein, partial [Fidelibacterota bacterium]
AHVTMIIYDVLGRQVRHLVDSHQAAGYKRVVWDGKDGGGNPVASVVYIYRISAGFPQEAAPFGEIGKLVSSKKLLLLR